MGKYIKHNSNYIRTDRHQFLKGGSTIFERDWVTFGSQLHFGPGKIPYYENGNFIFTKSPIPFYQKKHKNGVNVATWTYEDVENATSKVNKISFDEYSEDIRSYAYYGSCVELVRSSIENIIKTFPGMITKDKNQISYLNPQETEYALSGYYEIKNDFGFDLVNRVAKKGDDELKYLRISYENFLLNDSPIIKYDVIDRNMFVLTNDECVSNRKKEIVSTFTFLTKAKHKEFWVKEQLAAWSDANPSATAQQKAQKKAQLEQSYVGNETINHKLSKTLTLRFNDGGNYVQDDYTGSCYFEFGISNYTEIKSISGKPSNLNDFICYHNYGTKDFSIPKTRSSITIKMEYDYNTNVFKMSCSAINFERTYSISLDRTFGKYLRMRFYNEYTLKLKYNYLQEVSVEEYENNKEESTGIAYRYWTKTDCPVRNWTKFTSFQKKCDIEYDTAKHDWNYIIYSKLSDIDDLNRPLYEIDIKNEKNQEVKIVAYILNYEVVFMTNSNIDVNIRPNDEIIENYFNNLKGFEKQLLTRESKPLYSNHFVTPIEHSLGYVYYKRTYTWPSNGYCIDISSTEYFSFIDKLIKVSELYDELWTDNIWRRMTHEAIKNYDWTYTQYFDDGDEQANVNGGERMHKVINVIGRVFDDAKRSIDTIKRFNKITYNGDRNTPNALLSDKLELMGWDVYSTIPTITQIDEISDETIETVFPASDITISNEFLEENNLEWYPIKNNEKTSFADVDIEWMRRFILSSKRILETKGTIQSIQMIMGIFGYGNDCYDLSEEYYIAKPINYDEIYNYVNDNGETISIEVYNNLSDDDKKQYTPNSIGDVIVNLNYSKTNELLYDEDASGIPVGSFLIDRHITKEEENEENNDENEEENNENEEEQEENVNYLIPFYNQNKIYDGNFYFQSKGGWFYEKKEDDENGDFSWRETLSYLHVVSQVSDLLNVNPNSVDDGDIYYVVNVNDYFDNTETGLPLSHFFVLENSFSPELFSSWTNLDVTGELYQASDDDNEDEAKEKEKYREYAAKAKYLDNIVPDNIGNNPHVGYGKYDKGKEFIDYMRKPFKYAIDTYNFSYDDRKIADSINFEITKNPIVAGNMNNTIYVNKVQIDDDEPYEKAITENEYNIMEVTEQAKYEKSEKIKIFENGYKSTNADADNGRKNLLYKEYIINDIYEMMKEKYYLNSKVLYFRNLVEEENSSNYKDYFKNVIMKYIMQIIPSTTIMILENFD